MILRKAASAAEAGHHGNLVAGAVSAVMAGQQVLP